MIAMIALAVVLGIGGLLLARLRARLFPGERVGRHKARGSADRWDA